MKTFKTVQIVSLIALLAINIVGCSSEEEISEAVPSTQVAVVIISPELNRQEIDAINEKIQAMLLSNSKYEKSIELRLENIESRVTEVAKDVDKNTSAYEELNATVADLLGKVTNYFKPKKIAAIKKKSNKRYKQAKAPKPKYKVIGIDQWGAYKYVQLMDAQGNLRLLRRNESVDEWEVSLITDKKVVLVNAKGRTLVLIPQA